MNIPAATPHRKLTIVASILFVIALLVTVTSAAGAGSIALSSTLSDGQQVRGGILWRVVPTGGVPSRIDFSIDGNVRWTERNAPYDYNGNDSVLDTTELSEGAHVLKAVAYDGSGEAASLAVTVIVDNIADVTPAAPAATAAPAGAGGTDLALGKPTSSSSDEDPSLAPRFANDGSRSTRWSSGWDDNQWWQVDLGSVQTIGSVSIDWEAAYAKTYSIQISTNLTTFATVATESLSAYGRKTTTFAPVGARYVRVLGGQRATEYGFSAWDINIYAGSEATATPPTGQVDLGLGRTTKASSYEQLSYRPNRANDDNRETRWSSNFADNQWWQVDLGATRSISSVAVDWEAAYAKSYLVRASTDGSTFTTVASETMSAPAMRKSTFSPVNARFVRVVGLTRGTPYGFSAWDIRVYGDATPTTGSAPLATQLPSISGTSQVGSRMTSSSGTWSGSPTSYGYQWSRCTTGGACSNIADATTSAYTPVAADVGTTLRVTVSATNGVGTGTATSNPTLEVGATTAISTGSSGSKLPARLGASSGGALYVSGSGSDTNAGTIGAPFATIGKAWSVASAGTTINVRGGSYGGQINLQYKTASATNPVTVRAYPGERVVLSGPANEGYPAVFISLARGVRLQGFEIANDKGDGVKVDSATDVEIVGNDLHDNGMQGIIVGGSAGGQSPAYSSNVQIWGNRIHNNGGWWPSNDPYAAYGTHGIYYGNTGSNTDGVQHGTVGGVIADNLFYDQGSGYHIQVGSQNDGLVITSNTFDNSYQPNTRAGNAVQIYGEGNAFATKNVLVVNNIIANSANRGVYGSGDTMTGNMVRNNLAFNNPLGDFVPTYGSATLFTVGPGNVSADPRFVDRSTKAYQLTSSSPAIGKADSNYAPPVDFYGRARIGVPDLGAVEYQG